MFRCHANTANPEQIRGRSVGLFYDLMQAFDMVCHELLLQKLSHFCPDLELTRWIRNFLCDRTLDVIVEDTVSTKRKVCRGVPQGTVLGPLLFLVYVDDLLSGLNSALGAQATVVAYADDITVICHGYSSSTLLGLSRKAHEKMCHNDIRLSDKSSAAPFRPFASPTDKSTEN